MRMLIGREQDLERITRAVIDRSLVVLDGYSGVGKSSLLRNGLFHRLASAGFAVLVGGRWPRVPEGFDGSANAVERYVASGVEITHAENFMPPVPDGIDLEGLARNGGLCAALDDRYKDTGAVLILDQFEELLRTRSKAAEKVVEWIISVGYSHETRIVVSLRTDSLHMLEPLLRGVRPFSIDRIRIEEITDQVAIEEVIRTTKPSPSSRSAIADAAVKSLIELWDHHRPKLLALQATLYSLYFSCMSRVKEHGASDSGIDQADVDALRTGAEARGLDPFTFGLRDSIRVKIEHAEAACRQEGLDDYLVTGTREIVRRVAPLLSSGAMIGDFKIPLHESELALRSLARELRVLEREVGRELKQSSQPDSVQIDATVVRLFRALRGTTDYLGAPRGAVARAGGLISLGRGSDATIRRQIDVTAGPMMGYSATATLIEELRRVAFAIEWLESTEIVRKDPEGTVQLVHDGSGEALRDWAKAYVVGPTQSLRQLTGARGEDFTWANEMIGSHERYRVLANVNWRDCRITAKFQNLLFVNCDFSGSRFESCTFEGVTFINCLLDDADFHFCEMKGKADLVRVRRPREQGRETTRIAPSFTVETTEEEVSFFRSYLDHSKDGGMRVPEFFSDTSGMPAILGSSPSTHPGETIARFKTTENSETVRDDSFVVGNPVDVAPAAGGMAMVGGRLCLMTLYRCKSEENGSVAFHHVSGDGLAIVEQDGGTIDIYDAAIRGLSISRDVDEGSRATRPIRVTADDSVFANIYFAGGLAGTARIERSLVLMVTNASDNTREGFQVNLADCRYEFLVNIHEPEQSTEDSKDLGPESRYFDHVEGSHSRFRTRNREALANDLAVMDYRFHPEEWEDRQRLRRLQVRQ